jgi:hypothetical protein
VTKKKPAANSSRAKKSPCYTAADLDFPFGLSVKPNAGKGGGGSP